MGNKTSSEEDQSTQNVKSTQDHHAESKTSQTVSDEERFTYTNKKKTLSLSDSSAEELKKIGIRAEVADKLADEYHEGRLNAISDVVNVLESTGAQELQVKFDGNFQIEQSSSGAFSLKIHDPHRKMKRSFSFRRSFIGRKRQKSKKDDPVWKPDEEQEEKSENVDEKPSENSDKLDVNTASEAELEALHGVGPSLAKKIVQYRQRHGTFRQLDELVAVRGISRRGVRKLSSYLRVGEVEKSCDDPCANAKLNPVPSNNNLKYGKREVVRIITWNLQCFSNEKAMNEGVVEVICRTILENGISVAVFQEIGDEEAIIKLKDQLNHPTMKSLKKLKNSKASWECITSDVAGPMFRSHEYNGFLFDTSRGIEVKSHDLIEKPIKGKKQFSRRPFLGYFKISGFDFVVVSVHLKATGLGNEDIGKLQKELANIPEVISAIEEKIPGEKDMLIVGDFNLEPDEKEFDSFRKSGLRNLIPATMYTNISTSNMDGSKCYDNIWIGNHTNDHYSTGRAGVLRQGMRHDLIPDGWQHNGVVSDHCPVWGEFYCDRDMDKTSGSENVEDIVIQTQT